MDTQEMRCNFKGSIDDWVIDPAVDFAGDSSLTVRTNVDAVKNVWHTVTPSRSYTAEFKIKITGFGRENGFKLERKDVRLMVYFKHDGVSCVGTTGSVEAFCNLTEWTTCTFRVVGNICSVSVNGKPQFAYEMPTWHSDSDKLTFFMRARPNGAETKMELEYVNFIPDMLGIEVVSPAPKTSAACGEPVAFKAAVAKDDIPYVDFFANGTFIGRADKDSGYTMTCDNLKPGNYFIISKYGDMTSIGNDLTVTASSHSAVQVSNTAPRLGETLTLSMGALPNGTVKAVYYVDGKESADTFKVDFVGKAIIKAKLFYADGSYSFTEGTAVVSTADTGNPATELKSNYDLTYTAENGALVNASDGVYALEIAHTENGIKYLTADGERTYSLPFGKFRLQIDSGVCDAYFNDQFALSWRMPITDKQSGITYVNARDLTVTGHNADIFTLENNGGMLQPLSAFGFDYAAEFVLDEPRDFSLMLRDGAYCMELYAKDCVLRGKTYPNGSKGVVEEDVFCTLPAGRHAYRIPVVNGIAQLFIDNLWAYSFRLPVSNSMRCAKFEGIDKLVIRETDDLYAFVDNFDGSAELPSKVYYSTDPGVKADFIKGAMLLCPAHEDADTVLAPSGEYEPKTYTAYIKAYAYDPVTEATVNVEKANRGGVYITTRYVNAYRYVLAGYNFESGAWEIKAMNNAKLTVPAAKCASFPFGKDVSLKFVLDGAKASLYVDGKIMLTTDMVDVKYYGVAGIRAEHVCVKVTRFAYTGTGRPCPSAATFMNHAGSPEVFEYAPGNIYMISGPRRMLESTDDGITFRYVERPGYYNNTIRLKSGTIVSTHREIANSDKDTWIDYALVSTDNGATFEGPFPVQDYDINRITMNNKLTQASNGRLFLASGESGDGVEGEGGIRVFYSDDEGRTWKGSNILALDGKTVISGKNEARMDVTNTEVNCQESRVVEMPDGTLRLYVRTDEGFLYYSISTDNGMTWTASMQTSEFITVLSAYNIELDPYTGDYYTAWEYNVKNDSRTIQGPRTRVALAVSRDKMKSWEYVADIDEVANFNQFGHMNIGLKPTKTAVYVDAVKYPPNSEGKTPGCNYAVRVAKDTMKTTARFTKVHSVCPPVRSLVTEEAVKNMLLMKKDGSELLINDRYVPVTEAKAGYILLSAVAGCIGAELNETESTSTVTFGNAETVFTAGSDKVLVDGTEYSLSAHAELTQKGIIIPADALNTVFGRTFTAADDGTMISVFDRYGMLDINELASYAPWYK